MHSQPRPSHYARTVASLVALLVIVGACAEGSGQDVGDGPRIVVTTTILGDVVSDLVGDDAGVEVLMPAGADAHSFAISSRGATDMREADLLVINGLGLEEGMGDAIQAARDEGVPTFEATSAIDTIPFSGQDHEEDDHEGDDHEGHGGHDPHFWLDPVRMGQSIIALAAEIAEIDDTLPDEEWHARGEATAADMADLATEIEEILADVPAARRLLVTNHDAFGYFADAFDFEIVGSILPGGSTLAEASARDIEELVDVIEETGAPAIFVDASDSSRLADVVAEQAEGSIGVGTVNTGSLGELGGPAGTYRDYMISNATVVADLLGGGVGE